MFYMLLLYNLRSDLVMWRSVIRSTYNHAAWIGFGTLRTLTMSASVRDNRGDMPLLPTLLLLSEEV
jgi:hypothetical protein